MSTDAVMLIAYVMLALCFSFLCSVAEAVLLSITPSYIEEQKEKNTKLADLLIRLKQENVDRSLAAILTLNTIAHTVGAIMAGAKATVVFGSTWFGLFSAIMTLLILFFSEIVPKTIGAIYWSKLVRPTAFFVNSLIVALYPIVRLSESLTKFISHGQDIHIFSRTEFLAMARIGGQTGHLSDNESLFIANLFQFESLRVTEVMVPRIRVVGLDLEQTREQILEIVMDSQYSRFPVYRGRSTTSSVLSIARTCCARRFRPLNSIWRAFCALLCLFLNRKRSMNFCERCSTGTFIWQWWWMSMGG